MRFSKNEHLEFFVMGKTVKGDFISKNEDLIKIKVTYTEYTWEKIGDESSINKKYLINKK